MQNFINSTLTHHDTRSKKFYFSNSYFDVQKGHRQIPYYKIEIDITQLKYSYKFFWCNNVKCIYINTLLAKLITIIFLCEVTLCLKQLHQQRCVISVVMNNQSCFVWRWHKSKSCHVLSHYHSIAYLDVDRSVVANRGLETPFEQW